MCEEGLYRFLCPECGVVQNTDDYFSPCRFYEEDDGSCAMNATVWVGYIDMNCGEQCDDCDRREQEDEDKGSP
jgi:hypothetical protein